MKALVYNKNGRSSGLQQQEVNKPTPKKNEILIKVIASCLNNAEIAKFREAIKNGKTKQEEPATSEDPKNKILGTDVVGIVIAVGSEVNKFKIGDEILGITGYFNNAWTQYACLTEKMPP